MRQRSVGVLALVANDDVELAIGLAHALVPKRPPVVADPGTDAGELRRPSQPEDCKSGGAEADPKSDSRD